ncbi:hypothetical protein [Niabella aurantiaca]|uniref:hypothetical protein n=1 Tax=Niabella aurantiaca TaxID=379900 RepID=UPI00037704F4|nr:hypothetical protein [Niabella aurantiaca]
MKSKPKIAILVFVILISGITYSYISIGIAPLLIIGIPGIFAYWFWHATYLKNAIEPSMILPPFLATVAGFEFHLIEEYLGNYSQAISRIFNFAWTESTFFIVIVILSGALFLVTMGLLYKHPIAGFIAILFVMTRFAEMLLFIFPFIQPQIQAENANAISQNIGGTLVKNMPNYYFPTTGHYYFPGMYTWLLTLVPAIYCVYIIQREHKINQNLIAQ